MAYIVGEKTAKYHMALKEGHARKSGIERG